MNGFHRCASYVKKRHGLGGWGDTMNGLKVAVDTFLRCI